MLTVCTRGSERTAASAWVTAALYAASVTDKVGLAKRTVNAVAVERGSSVSMSFAPRPDSEVWMIPPLFRSPPEALTTTDRAIRVPETMRNAQRNR